MIPNNGSKITKKRFRATPHQRVEKNTLHPKSWKTRGFFTFFLAEAWRAGSRTSLFRTVFYSVLWRRASRPIKNRRFFPKNPPPQVNLNLSWLMPSGWSRPLHRPVRGGIYLASPAENFINAQLIQLSSKRSMIDSRLGWLGAAWGSPLLHSLLFLQRDERGHAPRPQNGSRRKEVKESEVWTRAESPWWTIFIYMINIHYDIIWYNTIW